MRMIRIEPYTISLFTEDSGHHIVYLVAEPEDAEKVWRLLLPPKPALAVISGVNWNCDLSPWSTPKVFRGGEDFSGGGPAFLEALTGQLIPGIEMKLGFTPRLRAIAGYSLAGLFALWSIYTADMFDQAASISGSLWFDGFLDYMNASVPHSSVRQVYLSLGDQEKKARNPRLTAVEGCTRQAAGLLQTQGVPVKFELNRGGHFHEVPERIARGINALTN